MLMDYWLAGWLGRAWMWLRISSRAENADMPGLCAAVARGETMSARRLCQVQDFAVAVWLRACIVPLITFITAGVVAKIVYGRAGVPTALVESVGSVLILLMGVAGAETTLLSYRARQSRLFLSGSRWGSPQGRLPRRSDFWLALALGLGGTGVLLLAGFGGRH
jgi:hypothetical protein